jgi:hypothetical protein
MRHGLRQPRNTAMTDDSTPKATVVVVEQIPSVAGGLSALASANAPFIYFDAAPNFGLNGGIANLSLEVVRFILNTGSQGVVADRVTVAHLRMSMEGVRSLKAALEGIELMASSTPGAKN